MERRPALLAGANAPLCGGLLLLLATAALLGPGPGSRWVAELRRERDEQVARLDAFDRERARVGLADDAERRSWGAEWDFLQEQVPPVRDQSALTARVAEAFQAPSVTRLEVRPVPEAERQDEESAPLELSSPVGRERVQLRALPVSVGFLGSFEDARALLSRPGAGMPARIDSIELARALPDVAVRLELTYFAREGDAS